MSNTDQNSEATPADVDESTALQVAGGDDTPQTPNLFSRALRKVGWGKKKREKEAALQEEVRFKSGLAQSLDTLNHRLSNQEALQGELVLEVLSLARTMTARQKELESQFEKIGLDNFALQSEVALAMTASLHRLDLGQKQLSQWAQGTAAQASVLHGETALEMTARFHALNENQKQLSTFVEAAAAQALAAHGEAALDITARLFQIEEAQSHLATRIDTSNEQSAAVFGETAQTINSGLLAIRNAQDDAKTLVQDKYEEAKAAALVRHSSLQVALAQGQERASSQVLAVQSSLADLLTSQKQELVDTTRFYTSELSGEVGAAANSLASAIALIAELKSQSGDQLGAIQTGIGEQFAALQDRLGSSVEGANAAILATQAMLTQKHDAASSQVLAVQSSLADLLTSQKQELVDTTRFYTSELSGEVGAAANSLASAIALIAELKSQSGDQLGAIQTGIGEQFAAQENNWATQIARLLSQGDTLRQRVDEAYKSINQQVTAVHGELEAAVSGSKVDMLAAIISARGASENASAAIERTKELTTAIVTSLRTDMTNTINGRANDLTSLLQLSAESSGAVEQRLTGHINDFRADIASYRRREEMMLRGLTSVAGAKVGAPPPDQFGSRSAAVIKPSEFDFLEQREALRKRAPKNFESWLTAFHAGADEYARNAKDSLSVGAHPAAMAFRMFLNFHARGRLLDIGCGPQAIPTYLEDYPLDQIAAIDPLAGDVAHKFVFAQSHAEFLPWPDESFETVVAATSIDHVYLLDVAIAEFARIMPRGGRLLVWTGLFAQTSKYDPYSSKIVPEDAYHLFHPGRNWFLECFEELFDLQEAYDHNQLNSFLAYIKR